MAGQGSKGGGQVQPATTNATPTPFNVNTAASQGLQGAMTGTAAAMTGPLQVSAFMNPYENQVVQQSLNDVRQNVGAAALRGGAFGGSRHGVTELDTMGDVAGRLRQSGFNTAVSNAMTDRSQRLGAANQLGGLANQAFNTGRTINQDMMQQGLLQQMLQQQLIDAAKSDFAGYTGSPANSLTPTIAALGATPVPQSTTTKENPGILNILGSLLPFF
jgi:hypothetical protein